VTIVSVLRGAAVRTLTLLAVAAACVLGLPGVATAGCGGTLTSRPSHHPAGQIPPLAIGDSTMLLSLPGLAADGWQANAHGCRNFAQGLQLLGELKAQGRLPHMVAIALGSDCCVSPAMVDQALAVLGSGRLLVLMTPVQLGGGDGSGAAYERFFARAHPGQVLLLDWVRDSAPHPSWFQPDRLHLTPPGVTAFTGLLASVMQYAYEPCAQPDLARPRLGRLRLTRPRVARARGLALDAIPRGRVGTAVAIHIGDRGHAGSAPLQLCTTPPGGVAACSLVTLAAGQRTVVEHVNLLRPGGWTIALSDAAGGQVSRIVWASDPGGRIRLYAAGDSEMQILDTDLAQGLGPHHVDVTGDARPSTGLTSPFHFNWENQARRRAAGLKPDVSVVSMGANDGYGLTGPSGQVTCCSAPWSADYANLVAGMMRSLLRGSAGRVYWVLLAAPQPSPFTALINGVNAGIRAAAARFPGRVGLIDANAFFTPGNVYRNTMTYHGQTFTIHEPDGVHLSASADAVLAQLIERRLIADHVIG
jgi:lysophospholipase L1-like esterase